MHNLVLIVIIILTLAVFSVLFAYQFGFLGCEGEGEDDECPDEEPVPGRPGGGGHGGGGGGSGGSGGGGSGGGGSGGGGGGGSGGDGGGGSGGGGDSSHNGQGGDGDGGDDGSLDECLNKQSGIQTDQPLDLLAFQKYMDYLANNYAIRGDLNEQEWKLDSENAGTRKSNMQALELQINDYLTRIDVSKGDDWIPISDYTNVGDPWYSSAATFGDLSNFLINKFLRIYLASPEDSKYSQSPQIKTILDSFVLLVQSKLKLPPDDFTFPWGKNWYEFSVTYPTFLTLWFVARHCVTADDTSSWFSYLDRPSVMRLSDNSLRKCQTQLWSAPAHKWKFVFTIAAQDDVDHAALTYFNNFYAYPVVGVTVDTENKPNKCTDAGCGIISMGWLRQGSNVVLMGLPWTIGIAYNYMMVKPTQFARLIDELRLDSSVKEYQFKENYISKYMVIQIRVNEAFRFNDQGIFGDGSFIYHVSVTAYGYLTSSYRQNKALNFLFEQAASKDETASSKKQNIDRYYEKYIFAKLEHPSFNVHTNFLYSRTNNLKSAFYFEGQLGAFVMHRISMVALKTKNWALIYRCQRKGVSYYEADKTNDSYYASWVHMRLIVDKYLTTSLDNRMLNFYLGCEFLRAEPLSIWRLPSLGTTTYPFDLSNSIPPVSAVVHFYDSLETCACGSFQAFCVDEEFTLTPVNITRNEYASFVSDQTENETEYGDTKESSPVNYFKKVVDTDELKARGITFNLSDEDDDETFAAAGTKQRLVHTTYEMILVTQNGFHCVRKSTLTKGDKGKNNQQKQKLSLGLGRTYNTGILTQNVKVIKEGQQIVIGDFTIYIMFGGVSDFKQTSFKNENGITQTAVSIDVDDYYAFSVLYMDDPSSPPINELTQDPTLSTENNVYSANIESFNWSLRYRDSYIYLYNKTDGSMKISRPYNGESDGSNSSYFQITRKDARKLLGDERVQSYRIRSASNALRAINYDTDKEREEAATDAAILDNPEASAENVDVKYMVRIEQKELYPDHGIDELECGARFKEYLRSNYEARVENVKILN